MLKETMYISLVDIEPDVRKCFAHLPIHDKKKETIEEHTILCQRYFMALIQHKNLNPVFEKFMGAYFRRLSKEADYLFKVMLMNVISFHDIGKVNPLFQLKKMEHEWKLQLKPDTNVGSKHSILSAVFYLDYFLQEIEKLQDKEERKILNDIAYIHSFIIAGHHGRLKNFEHYLNDFEEDSNGDILGWRAKIWLEKWMMVEHQRELLFNITPTHRRKKNMLARISSDSITRQVYLYGYSRMLYSLLVASDYYATSEYMNGIEINNFGNITGFQEIVKKYDGTEIVKSIRAYEANHYPLSNIELEKLQDINALRTELFLDAENTLRKNTSNKVFYLEAPTGIGKSNTAINLSFQLLKEQQDLNKIYYIYPFNTLVEQNIDIMEDIFDEDENIMAQIAVVNSLTPIKGSKELDEETLYADDAPKIYQKMLLDRQFMNYPIVLSTHVSLFGMLFGNQRDNLFGFHQLCNSVIVLDEIQSYRNDLWSEIIIFLKELSKLLNLKIIIISATLPNLELLTEGKSDTIHLVEKSRKYFNHPLFARRVEINYELLNQKITLEALAAHVMEKSREKKKILIEFIKKRSAEDFYQYLKAYLPEKLLLMTGDSSILERKKIIELVKSSEEIVLIATQVVEAGVDIDMDVGYKDISRLDSEEQFMGRINRSCKRNGKVYFYNLDDAKGIYRRDIRIDKEFTLENEKMKEILDTKEYQTYYNEILSILKMRTEKEDSHNIKMFFANSVGKLDYQKINDTMKLIDDKGHTITVYIARKVDDLDGRNLWKQYKDLLCDEKMEYAEKTVKMHQIKSQMNAFLYQFPENTEFEWDEQIGDTFYVEEGEDYFDENGILIKSKIVIGEQLFL